MRLLAHGIDLVETARIAAVLSDHPQRFLTRCFTPQEAADAETHQQPSRRHEFLAGRFAVKEAVLKALGTGLSGGVSWTDIETTRHPSGAPELRLTGSAAARAKELDIVDWKVSISHAGGTVIASVIALGQIE
jgi:holo-[acyl-carrier protein] synthase